MFDFAFREARAELKELLRKRENRTPWQPVPLALATVLPALSFVWAYYWCISRFRLHNGWFIYAIVIPCVVLALVPTLQVRPSLKNAAPVRGNMVLACGSWMALALGVFLGGQTYMWHMYSFYTYEELADYTNIDPSKDRGQSYMDAGQVYFRDASYVSVDDFSVYKSMATFCVAPIVSEALGEAPVPVDFWAVGLNCCNQETGDYHCGAVGDKTARAGLRLLRDDVRSYYALAVQEWSAKKCPDQVNTLSGLAEASPLLCPEVRHPLFFHWVTDPLEQVDAFHERGMAMFGMHVTIFCVGNFVVSLLLFWGLFALGFK
mmetsp:Transcript_49658/g.105724  ORF Transcript_49658/g.105724 Transcript_49658/m.105724 type:complete len:319 (+) Transcript_49658:146-1102(+)